MNSVDATNMTITKSARAVNPGRAVARRWTNALRMCAVFALLAVFASLEAARAQDMELSAAELDRQAVAAYRAEDHEAAAALWNAALADESISDGERARFMTNLGNVAARRDDWTRAAGWFQASLHLRPRDAETRDKLDFARSEAGWEPLDRGDLASTTERVLGAFTPDEARWLALLGLFPLAVALAGEALRGGRSWRRAVYAGSIVFLMATVPCIHASLREGDDPMLVTAPGGAAARAEPRDSAERIERLPSGSEWRRIDELPDWTELAGPDGRDVWVPTGDVFELRR